MGRKFKRDKVETFVIPKDLIIEAKKPKYNPYQTGTGYHESDKYNRKDKYKKDYRREQYE